MQQNATLISKYKICLLNAPNIVFMYKKISKINENGLLELCWNQFCAFSVSDDSVILKCKKTLKRKLSKI